MTEAAVSADVSSLVRMFEEAEQATNAARKLSERDRDYFDNKQWTPSNEISYSGQTFDSCGTPPALLGRFEFFVR